MCVILGVDNNINSSTYKTYDSDRGNKNNIVQNRYVSRSNLKHTCDEHAPEFGGGKRNQCHLTRRCQILIWMELFKKCYEETTA